MLKRSEAFFKQTVKEFASKDDPLCSKTQRICRIYQVSSQSFEWVPKFRSYALNLAVNKLQLGQEMVKTEEYFFSSKNRATTELFCRFVETN